MRRTLKHIFSGEGKNQGEFIYYDPIHAKVERQILTHRDTQMSSMYRTSLYVDTDFKAVSPWKVRVGVLGSRAQNVGLMKQTAETFPFYTFNF